MNFVIKISEVKESTMQRKISVGLSFGTVYSMWFYIYKSILSEHKFSLLVNFAFTAQFVFLIFRICMSCNLHVSARGDLKLFDNDLVYVCFGSCTKYCAWV